MRNCLVTKTRRGITALLAMLYLVLFSVLAIGFYTSTNTASIVVGNEVKVAKSLAAAESGLAFANYQMRQINVPQNTTADQLMQSVADQLGTLLNGTANMDKMSVGYNSSGIHVPGDTSKFIALDKDGAGFRIEITRSSTPGMLTAKVTAHDQGAGGARAVQINFQSRPYNSSVLNYGLATMGTFKLGGGYIKGSPLPSLGRLMVGSMSTTEPLTMSGGASIDGDVSFINPNGGIKGAGSIGGTTDSTKWPLNKGIAPPEFPTVDTSMFVNYLKGKETIVTTSPPSGSTISNVRVKANTNVNFGGGMTLKGVILIEQPNKVTFSGGPHIQGVIVVDDVNNTNFANEIIISGGGLLEGPQTLGPEYGELRNMTGSAILAPNDIITMTGGSASIGGSIVGKSLLLSGGGTGVVNGSILLTADVLNTFSGGSGITVMNGTTSGIPTGMKFKGHFSAVPSTYEEVAP